ncbi:hypothetical protein HDU81_005725 [Chytriomyces hyalinus]|nr:hypothetical protein HDU81_005725 [Chytriomyces hyalinus]
MTATVCTPAVLAAIEKLIVQDRPDASSADIVAASELASLRVWMQTNTAHTKHSVKWPPYQSHALYALTTDSRLLSRYLLDFTPPGVILPQHLVSADTLSGLLADPKHSYDVAVASIRYWASYEPAFQQLFTLAVHNHHPSKIIFDPVTSTFSEDPIAAYNMGLYIRDKLGLLELAAQWFANSSDGEYPPGMFEYAKFLSSPGWAYHLSSPDAQVEVSPTSNGQKSPSLKVQTRPSPGNRQQDLLENSIDSSRAISLLHQSYALEPNPETAFCIGMLYLHAPPRTVYHTVMGEPKSVSSAVPSAASSPARSLLATNSSSPAFRKPSEPLHVQTNLPASNKSHQEWPETAEPHSTKIRTLNLHRDPVKAAEYLSLVIADAGTAIRNRNIDGPISSPPNSDLSVFLEKRNLTSVAAAAAFELAKLYLVIGGDEYSERAVNLLHGVATLTSGSDMEGSERMGIVAAFLLGHCLKRGIGCSNKNKRHDEGDAWIRISNVKQAGVKDRRKIEQEGGNSSDLMSHVFQLVLNENTTRKSMAKAAAIIKRLVEQGDENMLNLYVLGVCHRLGVGGVFDAAKGEYWMNRAHATGSFVVPADCAVIEACLADPALLNTMMDVFGASKTGGDGGIPVSPRVPGSATEEYVSSAVSEKSAYSIASLPPLPSFYIVFQKPMADEQCPKHQYPPSLGPILSHWTPQEEDITIEDVIRTFDFF